eukprot:TRINITY_DN22822_c0_g1_i1.p2 TRINITY_DN22822_c0_g1~~TRINITY_DN22822_c0_g1_i1.p2  ORF type:complete len:110 (+),score=49.10 TRINITY_DN22822_c0_g1_i1:82-411(+)
MYFFFFFFKQKTAYEMLRSLVGSEMCIRDRDTMCEVLQNSEDQDGNRFDARGLDPVRMVGVDADQFDADFWNAHLDFLAEEWEWLEPIEVEHGPIEEEAEMGVSLSLIG